MLGTCGRNPGIGTDAVHSFAEIHAVKTDAGVDLVILESHERQCPGIGIFARAVGLPDREEQFQGARGGGLVTEAIMVAFRGNVSRERIQTAGPPEPRALVLVEGKNLLGQFLGGLRTNCQIAIEDVVNFRSVFQKEAVSDAAITNVISSDEVIRAMNGEPAVMAVPDGIADNG
jgi:hypothetical protein